MDVMYDQEVIERFFEQLMELRPVEATFHGLHEHDGRLPDGGAASALELQALVRRFDSELAVAKDGLDLDLARYYAALTRFQLEELRLSARMPEAPDQVGTGVFLLFARDHAPLEDRLAAIASPPEAGPPHLTPSPGPLKEPARTSTETPRCT